MAVSQIWGVLLVGVLRIRALLFGVKIRAADSWKFPGVYIPGLQMALRSSPNSVSFTDLEVSGMAL